MKKKRSRNLPLTRDGDSPAMIAAIAAIIDWGYIPARPFSDLQIKIRSISYYPDTGTFNFDGKRRERETGLDALRVLLDKHYGPHTRVSKPPTNTISLDDWWQN